MARIKFRLSSKVGQDGQSEILVRLYHSGIDQYSKTNLFVAPRYWDAKTGGVGSLSGNIPREMRERLANVRETLSSMEAAILGAFQEAGGGRYPLPSGWLDGVIHRKEETPDYSPDSPWLEVLDRYNGIHCRDISVIRGRQFAGLKREVERFLIYTGRGRAFRLCDVTGDTMRDFEDYLRGEHELYTLEPVKGWNPGDGPRFRLMFKDRNFKAAFEAVPESRPPQARGDNAIAGIMSRMRTFFRWTVEDVGIIPRSPFGRGRYTFKKEEYLDSVLCLTVEERDRLQSFDFGNTSLAVQRDIFLFQCLTGCRVSDLRSLKKSSVQKGFLRYYPKKTKNLPAVVPISPSAEAIIAKYKDLPGDNLLPCISDQKYNEAIKKMCRLAGLDRKVTVRNPTTSENEVRSLCEVVTSHVARKTFINCNFAAVPNADLIGRMSGHVPGSKAFKRYRNIEDEQLLMYRDIIETGNR